MARRLFSRATQTLARFYQSQFTTPSGDRLLMETGDFLLLETGDKILLE